MTARSRLLQEQENRLDSKNSHTICQDSSVAVAFLCSVVQVAMAGALKAMKDNNNGNNNDNNVRSQRWEGLREAIEYGEIYPPIESIPDGLVRHGSVSACKRRPERKQLVHTPGTGGLTRSKTKIRMQDKVNHDLQSRPFSIQQFVSIERLTLPFSGKARKLQNDSRSYSCQDGLAFLGVAGYGNRARNSTPTSPLSVREAIATSHLVRMSS